MAVTKIWRVRGAASDVIDYASDPEKTIETFSEEVTAAGLVKGIDAPIKRTSYFEQKFRFTDALILVLFIAGLIGGFVWYKK